MGVGVFAVTIVKVLPRHFGYIQRVLVDCHAVALIVQLFAQSRFPLGRRNHVELDHIVENVFLAQFGTLGIHNRIKGRGRFGQTGQNGGFAQRQILYRFVEIDSGRGGKTIGALAEINLVEVKLENLVFGQVLLDFVSQKRFV